MFPKFWSPSSNKFWSPKFILELILLIYNRSVYYHNEF
ncbi:hypothetical protein BGP_6313 [Beggiatoa sp. PS]|nr:hypothetical protein BGP_6313 [Beggiatoa sp. PS]